jgi:phosphate transport system substrate-binding protein
MADDVPDTTGIASRRQFLLASGAAGTALIAGCLGSGGSSGSNNSDESGGGQGNKPLTAGGSSTVYPITSQASSVWNSNPPVSDQEYWPTKKYNIDTKKPLADYWAGLYGFKPAENGPPFRVTVGLSHSGTGLEKLMDKQIDIADSSAPVKAEFPKRDGYEKFTDHVIAVDGQPIVVSKPIYDAGVKKLTGKELKGIYMGDITNWQQIDSYKGPKKEIQTICRSEGSGTDTAFRNNLFGSPNAPIKCDVRKGQNQQVKQLVSQADNAIAYVALAFVGKQTPAVALEINGTTYKLGENLGAKGYPLSRDLHCYTWKGTSKKEAAFLRMILSKFGQESFVATNNYFKLPPKRRKNQRKKLPDTMA